MSQPALSNSLKQSNQKSLLRLAWEQLELSICLVAMVAMTIIVFAQVIARYVFHNSFEWAEEISRFLVVWITFGGSAYAFRKGAHIGVTAMVYNGPIKLDTKTGGS